MAVTSAPTARGAGQTVPSRRVWKSKRGDSTGNLRISFLEAQLMGRCGQCPNSSQERLTFAAQEGSWSKGHPQKRWGEAGKPGGRGSGPGRAPHAPQQLKAPPPGPGKTQQLWRADLTDKESPGEGAGVPPAWVAEGGGRESPAAERPRATGPARFQSRLPRRRQNVGGSFSPEALHKQV